MQLLKYKDFEKNSKLLFLSLKKDGIISYPTDTVRGFSCALSSLIAIKKIKNLKKRPVNKPFILLIDGIKMAEQFVEIDPEQSDILKKYWPGSFTFLLKLKNKIKLLENFQEISGNYPTVGLRNSSDPVSTQLISLIKEPLVSTSANLSGEDFISEPRQFEKIFGEAVDFFVENPEEYKENVSSTIIDISEKEYKIIRQGAGQFNG